MAYVTDQQLSSLIHLPVCMPLTEIGPENWLVISSTLIQQGQSFTLRWLQMNLLSLAVPSTGADTLTTAPTADGICVFPSGNASLITPGYGLAYIGLYLNFNALVSPAIQAAQEAPLILGDAATLPPANAVRSTTLATYAAPGPYSFVLVNNTTDSSLRITVGGQIIFSLGPP
jgi:hypothetical protein